MGFRDWLATQHMNLTSIYTKTLNINGVQKTFAVEVYPNLDAVPEHIIMKMISVMKQDIKAEYEKRGTKGRGLIFVHSTSKIETHLIHNDKYPCVMYRGKPTEPWIIRSEPMEVELIKFCNELFTHIDVDTESYEPAKDHLYPRHRHPYVLSYNSDTGYEILFVKNL